MCAEVGAIGAALCSERAVAGPLVLASVKACYGHTEGTAGEPNADRACRATEPSSTMVNLFYCHHESLLMAAGRCRCKWHSDGSAEPGLPRAHSASAWPQPVCHSRTERLAALRCATPPAGRPLP